LCTNGRLTLFESLPNSSTLSAQKPKYRMSRVAKSSDKTSKSQAISSTSKISTKPKSNRATSSSATAAAPMKHSTEEATTKVR
jgi:hypothetical protein